VKDPKLQPFKVSVTHQLTEVDRTSVCTKKYIVICTISENSRIGLRRLDCSALYTVSNLKKKMKKILGQNNPRNPMRYELTHYLRIA